MLLPLRQQSRRLHNDSSRSIGSTGIQKRPYFSVAAANLPLAVAVRLSVDFEFSPTGEELTLNDPRTASACHPSPIEEALRAVVALHSRRVYLQQLEQKTAS